MYDMKHVGKYNVDFAEYMQGYKLRYPCDQQKQQAYEDACDCISSGAGMTVWKSCELSLSHRYIVWWRAAQDVGNLEMV